MADSKIITIKYEACQRELEQCQLTLLAANEAVEELLKQRKGESKPGTIGLYYKGEEI